MKLISLLHLMLQNQYDQKNKVKRVTNRVGDITNGFDCLRLSLPMSSRNHRRCL
jgi:hypothetical protein